MLTLPLITTRGDLEKVAQIFLETFGVAALHIAPREALLANGTQEAVASGAVCWRAACDRAADGATAWLRRDVYDELGPEAARQIWDAGLREAGLEQH